MELRLADWVRLKNLSNRIIVDAVDREKLMIALDTYIFRDATMKENTGSDIEKRLKITFSDRGYIRRLDTSDERWIEEE